ncbi:MAG: L-ribulose-5-phosphate 4-epimerase [Bacteroidota bacterium]
MLEDLRREVLAANLELAAKNLVAYTFGNASGIDRRAGLFAIKPSGVPYEDLTAEMLVIVDLDGRVVEGRLNPSSDMPTHLELYRSFAAIGGVVHTHSKWATAWAQARLSLPCFGTTHADYFYGEVPCTRPLTDEEINGAYEVNAGRVIVERFRDLECMQVPGVLVAGHGPFTWGKDAMQAAHHSVILEDLARMGAIARQLNPALGAIPQTLLDRHFMRKHGRNAYYGQKPG